MNIFSRSSDNGIFSYKWNIEYGSENVLFVCSESGREMSNDYYFIFIHIHTR